MSVDFKKIIKEAEQRKKDNEAINMILEILHTHNLEYVEDLEKVFAYKDELESKIERLEKVINVLIECSDFPSFDKFIWHEDLKYWDYSDWTYSIILDDSSYNLLKEFLVNGK